MNFKYKKNDDMRESHELTTIYLLTNKYIFHSLSDLGISIS